MSATGAGLRGHTMKIPSSTSAARRLVAVAGALGLAASVSYTHLTLPTNREV